MNTKVRCFVSGKVLTVIAVSTLVMLWSALAVAQQPIKIGVISNLTGPGSVDGQDVANAVQMAIDEAKNTAAGRPIKVIVEDDTAKPPVGLAKARKLVMEDGVHIITGVLQGNVNAAVAPYANEQKVPLLAMASSPTDYTYKKTMPYFFRLSPSGTQLTHPFGDWAAKKLGVKEVATIAMDYTYGYDNVSSFQRTFEEPGGKVIQKIWLPMDVMDLAPYISKINKSADAVFVLLVGSNALRFAKQFDEAGLKNKMKVLAGPPVTSETVLQAMGDEAVGFYSVSHWSSALQTPEAQKFVAEYRKRYKGTPGMFGEAGYCTGLFILEAIKAAKGNVEAKPEFLEILKKTKVAKSPRGTIEVDEYNSAVLNTYILKVERVGGKLQNTVIDTIPSVSQFWKFNVAAFLKEPLYSRDYPPCKYCK